MPPRHYLKIVCIWCLPASCSNTDYLDLAEGIFEPKMVKRGKVDPFFFFILLILHGLVHAVHVGGHCCSRVFTALLVWFFLFHVH